MWLRTCLACFPYDSSLPIFWPPCIKVCVFRSHTIANTDRGCQLRSPAAQVIAFLIFEPAVSFLRKDEDWDRQALPLKRLMASSHGFLDPVRSWRAANMLILSRRQGESIVIGGGVTVTVLKVKGHTVQIGIDAPRETPIRRSELRNLSLEFELPLVV
jgi:carbon storage regulator CsrA